MDFKVLLFCYLGPRMLLWILQMSFVSVHSSAFFRTAAIVTVFVLIDREPSRSNPS